MDCSTVCKKKKIFNASICLFFSSELNISSLKDYWTMVYTKLKNQRPPGSLGQGSLLASGGAQGNKLDKEPLHGVVQIFSLFFSNVLYVTIICTLEHLR